MINAVVNGIVTHGYAHRLTQSGVIESKPQDGTGDWQQRSPESMDLLGGDYELIRELLYRLSDVFKDGQRRTPESPKEYEAVAENAMRVV